MALSLFKFFEMGRPGHRNMALLVAGYSMVFPLCCASDKSGAKEKYCAIASYSVLPSRAFNNIVVSHSKYLTKS